MIKFIGQYRLLSSVIALAASLALISFFSLSWVESKTRSSVRSELVSRQTASAHQFEAWLDMRLLQAREWADRSETRAFLDSALNAQRADWTAAKLNSSPQQLVLRKVFSDRAGLEGLIGFFVISTDGISLGSLREANTGSRNLLWNEPDFVERMRTKGVSISPLMTSDVALPNAGISLDDKPLTLFVGVPIFRGGRQEPDAYFTIRVPPISLLAVEEKARFGSGGVSYLVDRQGRLHADGLWLGQGLDGSRLPSETFRGRQYIFARDPGHDLRVEPQATVSRPSLPFTKSALGIQRGERGASLIPYRDHRGVDVVGAWRWDDRLGLGIITEIPVSEAYAPIEVARQRVLVAWTVVAVVVVVMLLARLLRSSRLLQAALTKADAASRAKGIFLANMSHEIRTPMNAIIGITHLLTKDAGDATQRTRLDKVSGAAQHLLQVINDVLDLSKIEAGKLELDRIEFSLDTLMERVFALVSGRAADKGLELIIDTDRTPRHLIGDPTRLSQMLINLLANAVKFTDHGWVRVRCIVLGTDGPLLQVRFEVQDTGIGISPDEQGKLFQAFEQVEAGPTRRFGGTGLGLALTRQFAAAMKGSVGVTSEIGQGSTFWFTAWLEKANAQEPAVPSGIPEGLKALLVDDLPEALEAIGDRLRALGLDVDSIQDAATAVKKVRGEAESGRFYDLFLIDWRMQPIDGIETLRQMRGILGDKTPPSVLFTAADDSEMRLLASQERYDDVLIKPLTSSTLHDCLARVLGKRRPIPTPRIGVDIEAGDRLKRLYSGRRVLLVEDNPVNRWLAGELLQSVGLVVETAEDGLFSVDMALTGAYDLIMMDMQMPRMNGLDATRAIRSRETVRIPIIAMTANAFADERQECLDAGMDDHIAKPVDPAHLYATLLRWLDSTSPPNKVGEV